MLNLPRNKFCRLQQYVAQSRPEFYFFEQIFSTCNTEFVAWKVEHVVVIRATTLFNLQCNNVAQQVERGKCCPYYLALRELHDDNKPYPAAAIGASAGAGTGGGG